MSQIPSLLELSRITIAAVLRDFAQKKETQPGRQGLSPLPLTAVDATCGNGHDTLFLSRELAGLAGEFSFSWQVVSFDIQDMALESARARLTEVGLAMSVEFIKDSHEHMNRYLSGTLSLSPAEFQANTPVAALAGALAKIRAGRAVSGQLAAVMFNLGYLPGGDKGLVTRPESTLPSLGEALEALAPGGILSVHAYGGHPGGLEEMEAVDDWFSTMPFSGGSVFRYEVCNKRSNPEKLFLVEKK